uniref:Putative ovule protein n=1 Tax=Solanum chacoense TaxID=4108 RepID=A0A0V0H6Q0_SOLCH
MVIEAYPTLKLKTGPICSNSTVTLSESFICSLKSLNLSTYWSLNICNTLATFDNSLKSELSRISIPRPLQHKVKETNCQTKLLRS